MASDNEVEVKSLDDCFDFLGGFINAATIKSVTDFEDCLEAIALHASNEGLSNEQLEVLQTFLWTTDLRVKSITLIVYCLVPKTYVPSNLARKIVLYVLSHYNKIPAKATISLLQWIIALLEFELTDVKVVDAFYRMFYFLLKFSDESVHRSAAQVIYMLTKPDDVVEEKIFLITDLIQKKYPTKPYFLKALLSLFKCYQPELVPDKIPVMKTITAFTCLPDNMIKSFGNAQKRNMKDENGPANPIKLFYKNVINTDLTVKRTYTDIVLQTPEYLNKTALFKRKITDMDSIEELEENIENVELPSNVLCLLATDAGLHYLAFGGPEIQKRFAYKLNDTFSKVFLRCTMNASFAEKELLLERVLKLETFMEQGLFVVSRFLATYLYFWNGLVHRTWILRLVEWVTFGSFSELRDRILLPLYELFVASDVDVKCDIIDSLAGLLTNMFLVDVIRFKKETKPLFLGVHPDWVTNNYASTLGHTLKTMIHFLTAGLLLDSGSNKMLHTAISFYNLIYELELKSRLPAMSVASPPVVYGSLFSNNTAAFKRVCQMLLNSRSRISQMDPDVALSKYRGEMKIIEQYVNDIMNVIWFGKAISNRDTGLLFKTMPTDVLMKLNEISNPDTAFVLSNNIMVMPYIVSIMKCADFRVEVLSNKENVLEIMETYSEEIVNLINQVLESEENHFISVLYGTNPSANEEMM